MRRRVLRPLSFKEFTNTPLAFTFRPLQSKWHRLSNGDAESIVILHMALEKSSFVYFAFVCQKESGVLVEGQVIVLQSLVEQYEPK